MNRFSERLKAETFRFFLVFFFFFAMFCFINLADSFLLRKAGLPPFTYLEILIAAALVAKILLVLDHLPFVNLFHRHPLIVVILSKTIFYWIITLIVRSCIRFYPYLFSQKTIALDFNSFVTQADWGLFITIQAWYLILFFLFVTGRELTEAIGSKKMVEILFKRRY